MISKEDALKYHSSGRPGKIEVVPTKPCLTQRDLSLAYSPGVADPCLEIQKDPAKANIYTSRGNLVAVISNGTAVLGLGDIGALAGKPVMEGKGVLFKRFSDIDVFDIELDTHDVEEFIKAVKLMEPTFGGINLEDIKAPECFEIEQRLIKEMNIPVFHDDQHGTAIISAAGLINAVELTGKKIGEIQIVISGAGASAISCARHYLNFGVQRKNVTLVDSAGVVYKDRPKNMNKYKEEFAGDSKARTLAEAMKGADVFIGLSAGGIVSKDMVRSMAKDPIVFAMANPDPEITYDDAKEARPDVIMGTGRSDFPNQINNVLGFPFIFRGALDVHATRINDEMKMAASLALAKLAKEDVPDSVSQAYGENHMTFGRDYIIPKPFDARVLLWEAPAVAQAAMDSGVAKKTIDLEEYKQELEARLGGSRMFMRSIFEKAKRNPKRIVFPEGQNEAVIRATRQILKEEIAKPILLGHPDEIMEKAQSLAVDLDGVEIIDIYNNGHHDKYTNELYQLRNRKGMTRRRANNMMFRKRFFGSMMVRQGDADGMVAGITMNYPETIRPALQILETCKDVKHVAGMYILIFKNQIKILSDVTVNINPDAETLAEITLLTAREAKRLGIEPRIAMLSFSNFGSSNDPEAVKIRAALKIIKEKKPDLIVDGEMHADVAVSSELLANHFPFSDLKTAANVLICPNLTAGNIAYKLLDRLGGATAIGPVLMGLKKPVHLLQYGTSTVEEIVNMTAITVIDAQDDC